MSKWDVTRVTDMASMFKDAASFNVDVSKWTVSSVTAMHYMFNGANAFSRTLCGTWTNGGATTSNMFRGSSGGFCFG